MISTIVIAARKPQHYQYQNEDGTVIVLNVNLNFQKKFITFKKVYGTHANQNAQIFIRIKY